MNPPRDRVYAMRKYSKKSNLCGGDNSDNISSAILEGSLHQLNSCNLKYVAHLKSSTWSTIDSKDSGLRIHVTGATDPFITLDRYVCDNYTVSP